MSMILLDIGFTMDGTTTLLVLIRRWVIASRAIRVLIVMSSQQAELRPISCTGGKFDLIKIPYVTLVDTLDTLVVLGDYQEFKRAVAMLTESLTSFDYDINVSLFETTIRMLGGLVSAHLMAIDPQLKIYVSTRRRSALQLTDVWI
jgi:hypothetical protein